MANKEDALWSVRKSFYHQILYDVIKASFLFTSLYPTPSLPSFTFSLLSFTNTSMRIVAATHRHDFSHHISHSAILTEVLTICQVDKGSTLGNLVAQNYLHLEFDSSLI